MFDIHSHIIYHIDDGSRTPEESLALIRQDSAEGARDIIATPHYYVQYPTDPDRIRAELATIQNMADADGLDVHLYPGNEVLWFDSMTERLQSGEILTLADSHYTLIEFYPEEGYQTILRAVRNVRNAGYRPIIAHAERFRAMQEHGLEEVRDLGAYVQLSTEPLSHKGLSGLLDRETKFIQKALKNQQADFLGTDMHRTDHRPPVLRDAIRWIEKNLDPDYADDVLKRNAETILRDEEIY
ncbi:MAG: CpsB/CapC family capsule biosynthesis tyrosine phosphatase [Oribacterium sp.]|nr:CpsB/CapC family capsule biosynthesis tyrosine phosphatase [Oribacterium sp.]